MSKLKQLRDLMDSRGDTLDHISKVSGKIKTLKELRSSHEYECMECGNKFKGHVDRHGEVKCPKCGSYDVENV